MDQLLPFPAAVQNAKDIQNTESVLMAVHLHPEWLTQIPEGRNWAILHHVVFSGIVQHLEPLLAVQKNNPNFRLLTPTADNKTVEDIAKAHDPQSAMFKRIDRLITLDRMLNHAKSGEWNECYAIVKANPTYGNEKSPYRRFYLIHHIAVANDIDVFKQCKQIENFTFDMTLRADREKINVIARKAGAKKFAEYIEKEYGVYFGDEDLDDSLYEPSEEGIKQTNIINVLMDCRVVLHESAFDISPVKDVNLRQTLNNQLNPKLAKAAKPSPAATELAQKYPVENILSMLTCALTHAIVTDPVVAADGFTYERQAIENWLKTHDRSPVTNEKLVHTNVNPNIVVKQILNTLTGK